MFSVTAGRSGGPLSRTVTVSARGALPAAQAWQRYADLRLWSSWAPQVQGVRSEATFLAEGVTGSVRAGLLPAPTLPVPFRVDRVDAAAMTWTWTVHLGPVSMTLDHGVAPEGDGSTTWLRVRGPAPVVLAYAPLARVALRRLVRP